MDKADFDEYINGRYLEQIRWYDSKALWSKKWFSRFQWGTIILSALMPVLIAVDLVPGYDFLEWIPILTSVAVAVLSSGLKTFKFQERWVHYRTTCEVLKREFHLYQAGVGEYSSNANRATLLVDKDALFVERVESLLAQERALWLTIYGRIDKDREEVNDHIGGLEHSEPV